MKFNEPRYGRVRLLVSPHLYLVYEARYVDYERKNCSDASFSTSDFSLD